MSPREPGEDGTQLSQFEQVWVDRYFQDAAQLWDHHYRSDDIFGTIIQYRQALSLKWIDGLSLDAGELALDVGCGAGHLSVELAMRGLKVLAVDTVPRMLELAAANVVAMGHSSDVTIGLGDVQALHLPDGCFSVAVALGVLDWVYSPAKAMHEISRVLKPGGWAIVSCGHPAALVYLLEPLSSVVLSPARRVAKSVLQRTPLRSRHPESPHARMLSRRSVDALLSSSGLLKVDWCTVGFGPILFFGREALPQSWGHALNRRLQSLADARLPAIGSVGMGYMVLARKA